MSPPQPSLARGRSQACYLCRVESDMCFFVTCCSIVSFLLVLLLHPSLAHLLPQEPGGSFGAGLLRNCRDCGLVTLLQNEWREIEKISRQYMYTCVYIYVIHFINSYNLNMLSPPFLSPA